MSPTPSTSNNCSRAGFTPSTSKNRGATSTASRRSGSPRPVSVTRCVVTAETVGATGVEMEALTAASVAALTIYDMCKAMSHEIVISEIKLLERPEVRKTLSQRDGYENAGFKI